MKYLAGITVSLALLVAITAIGLGVALANNDDHIFDALQQYFNGEINQDLLDSVVDNHFNQELGSGSGGQRNNEPPPEDIIIPPPELEVIPPATKAPPQTAAQQQQPSGVVEVIYQFTLYQATVDTTGKILTVYFSLGGLTLNSQAVDWHMRVNGARHSSLTVTTVSGRSDRLQLRLSNLRIGPYDKVTLSYDPAQGNRIERGGVVLAPFSNRAVKNNSRYWAPIMVHEGEWTTAYNNMPASCGNMNRPGYDTQQFNAGYVWRCTAGKWQLLKKYEKPSDSQIDWEKFGERYKYCKRYQTGTHKTQFGVKDQPWEKHYFTRFNPTYHVATCIAKGEEAAVAEAAKAGVAEADVTQDYKDKYREKYGWKPFS